MGNWIGFLFYAYGIEFDSDDEDDCKMDTSDVPTFSPVDSVLDKIFNHCGLKTLEVCRLVTQNWCVVASKEIQSRLFIKLEFHQDKLRPSFATRLTKQRLSDLNSLLGEENFNLFCTSFEFHGNMGLQDARQFFKVNGHQVKTLVVKNLINYFTRWTVLSELLVEAPNITELTVLGNNFDYDFESSQLLVEDLVIIPLPNLIVFKLNYETTESTLYKILVGANNLKRVENFDLRHIAVFFKCGKPFVIKKLCFFYPPENEEEKRENTCQIVDTHNLIFELVIPDPLQYHVEDRWCNAAISQDIIKILELGKDYLEELHILPLGWLEEENTYFVKFPRLKHLKISAPNFDPKCTTIFPITVREPTGIFPYLSQLTLNFEDYSSTFWSNCWPKDTKFWSVKTLNVLRIEHQPIDKMIYGLEQMRIMFPHVSSLRLGCTNQTCELLTVIFKIWQGNKLSSLEFDYIDTPQSPHEVDSILTGIDKEECAHLLENLNAKKGDESVEDVLKYLGNERPSIRSFTGLYDFKIVFKSRRGQINNPVTMVSYRYAFNLMPKVDVAIITI